MQPDRPAATAGGAARAHADFPTLSLASGQYGIAIRKMGQASGPAPGAQRPPAARAGNGLSAAGLGAFTGKRGKRAAGRP